ncbi:MAG: UDP-glucose 4-epimerase GalE [Planctomycetota bacterium]|nr:MAG: UDP-glucose 4-epimerase GalE [Planctomycetota bacterium]
MRIFVTGGAGYVGSHCVKDLCEHGHEVVVIDNLCKGHRSAVYAKARLIEGDVGDAKLLRSILTATKFDAVMHFAASAEVGESVREPLSYYHNNVSNTLTLLELMRDAGIHKIVFSSSCATYGMPASVPIREDTPQLPINPYGRTKLAVEWMLADSASAWGLGSCALRYFNACGAARDGSIGEDHNPESHLIPIILETARGRRSQMSVFGTDYDTPDGTCIRDYIHVEDLASAHRLAIEAIEPGVGQAFNIGTGRGNSVLEVIEAARRITGQEITIEEVDRRPGDPPILIADASRIGQELGWKPDWTDIEDIVGSAWQWHQSHPEGFEDD